MDASTNEPSTASTIENTVIATLEAAAPALLASSSPAAASAAALAPIALQFLQSAIQLQNAGLMTADQLATNFASIGAGIQATHNAWLALNTSSH